MTLWFIWWISPIFLFANCNHLLKCIHYWKLFTWSFLHIFSCILFGHIEYLKSELFWLGTHGTFLFPDWLNSCYRFSLWIFLVTNSKFVFCNIQLKNAVSVGIPANIHLHNNICGKSTQKESEKINPKWLKSLLQSPHLTPEFDQLCCCFFGKYSGFLLHCIQFPCIFLHFLVKFWTPLEVLGNHSSIVWWVLSFIVGWALKEKWTTSILWRGWRGKNHTQL